MLQPASVMGGSPVVPATSGEPTDDGQSGRQPVITAATSDAPTTSYRAAGSSQQRRANNLVLFVRANDDESEAASRGPTLASQPHLVHGSNGSRRGGESGSEGGDGGGEGAGGGGDGSEDGEQPDILSLIVSASTSTLSSVGGVATGAARKPLVTVALVLLYFILLDIVLLNGNERLNRVLRRIRATEDDALILLSTSLVRQLADARRDVEDAVQARKTALTMEGLEPVLHKVQALERVCNRSLTHLHAKLMFPGSPEDLLFLITEHATFDDRLHDLAVQELQWESTVSAAHIADAGGDVLHPTTPDKAGPAAPTAAAADTATAAEQADAAAASNPLRYVRLQRVVTDAQSAKEAAAARVKRTKSSAAAAAARKRAGEAASLAAEAMDVEEAAAGLLAVFKNKFVAFLLMCVLLSAVLRMG